MSAYKKTRYLVSLCVLLLGADTDAQTPLSLQECMDLAFKHNLQHRRNRQNLESSYASLQQARSPFELQARMDLTLPRYSERRETLDLEALTTRVRAEDTDFRYAGNLRLEQRVPYLGRFTVHTRGSRQDLTSNRRQDFLDYNGNINLDYTHEVLTRPSEEIALEQAELSLVSARTRFGSQRLETESRVIDEYYSLVQSIRRLEIEEQRLGKSRANLDLAQRKFEIGLIREVEVLRLNFSLLQAEASYAQAQTLIESNRDRLRQQLGMELDEPLEVITEVDYQKYSIDEARALEVGLKNHTDLQLAELGEQISQLNLEKTRRTTGPTAQLNAGVSLGGQGSEIGDISRNFERNLWNVGIEVQVPLIDGGTRRSQLNQAKINLEQSRLNRAIARQEITRQIRNAVRNLGEAERRIELGELGLEVAERAYEVEQSRFELGLAESQQLLDAQADLTDARVTSLNAIINYQRQLKELRLATMADLSELVEKD